jgi:hypothetical protein
MCFSAEASFTSAGLLTALTYACTTQVTSKRQYPLIGILIVLVFMQLIEGFEWLAFRNDFFPAFFIPLGAYYFFFVVSVVWPLIIPTSLFLIEKDPRRQKILKGFVVAAVIIAIGAILLKINGPSPTAEVVGRSIQYKFYLLDSYPYGDLILTVLSTVMILCPFLFSSEKAAWLFLLLTLITAAVTIYFYFHVYTSVWCFFSTVSTCAIFYHLYKVKQEIER